MLILLITPSPKIKCYEINETVVVVVLMLMIPLVVLDGDIINNYKREGFFCFDGRIIQSIKMY